MQHNSFSERVVLYFDKMKTTRTRGKPALNQMDEYTKRKRNCKIFFMVTGIAICIFVVTVAILLSYAKVKNYQFYGKFANALKIIGYLLFIILCIAIINGFVVIFKKPQRHILIKIPCVCAIIGLYFFMLFSFPVFYLAYAFSIREEKAVLIDQEKYIIRIEGGFPIEYTGLSYHKKHGLFYEAGGKWVEFDEDLWKSY